MNRIILGQVLVVFRTRPLTHTRAQYNNNILQYYNIIT